VMLTGMRMRSGGEQESIGVGSKRRMKTVNNQQADTCRYECRNTSNKLQECPVSGMPTGHECHDTESPGVVSRR